jgi:hypothetical protein
MCRFHTEVERTVAVLHDGSKTAPPRWTTFRRMGYSEPNVRAIDCLTRREGEE